MMHRNRTWGLPTEAEGGWLAQALCRDGMVMTPCSVFRLRDSNLLLLNDATSPDGAQEYAVVVYSHEAQGVCHGWQVESLTCSWMTRDALHAALERYAGILRNQGLAGFLDLVGTPKVQWKTHPRDTTCRWCA